MYEEYTVYYESSLAFILVVVAGAFGGLCVSLLKGIDMEPNFFLPRLSIKPIIKTITIPPLIGMIVFGCFTRNFLSPVIMAYYPA